MKAVLFDLDDTLYPEIAFVRSGFRAAAGSIGASIGVDPDALAEEMERALETDGRGAVFDTVLRGRNAWSETRVARALHAYRTHDPSIALYADAERALVRLRRDGIRTGVLTDGMGSVQRRKVAALGLEGRVDRVVCSDELGRDRWKPDGTGYLVLLDLLGVGPREAAYVGNDAAKDFVWPNRSGMLSIEVRRPGFRSLDVPERHRASRVVGSLDELDAILTEGAHGD